MEQVFSFVDLSEQDHQFSTFKYSGNEIKNNICICAVSPTSLALFSSIVEDFNPVGFFITTIHDIINPIDYANGNEPSTKFIRSFRNEVYVMNDMTIILYEKPNVCTKEAVNTIFDLVKPEKILVFTSLSNQEFKESIEIPKLFFLSNFPESNLEQLEKLPSPHKIEHMPAGLLILGDIYKVNVCVYALVEDLAHPAIESMKLMLSSISNLIQCDTEITAKQALQIATARFANHESYHHHSIE